MTQINIGRRGLAAIIAAVVILALIASWFTDFRGFRTNIQERYAAATAPAPANFAVAPKATTDITAQAKGQLIVIVIGGKDFVSPSYPLEAGKSYTVVADNEKFYVADFTAQLRYELVPVETGAQRITLGEPTVAPATLPVTTTVENKSPVLFDAQSCDPEQSPDGGCSWDIGAWSPDTFGGKGTAQVVMLAGVDISWPAGGVDFANDPNNRCEFVVMDSGVALQNVNLMDGRMEVYTISTADVHGWTNVLAVQGVQTQHDKYGCPAWKKSVPFWTLVNGKVAVQQLALTPIDDISRAAAAGQSANPAQATTGTQPELTGKGLSKDFAAGSSVVAYKITLDDGTILVPQGCYAKDLKKGGTATDGVINPVAAQYQGAPACTNIP